MIFTQLPLHGAYLIELDCKNDDRGFFARTFCENEFSERGLSTSFIQMSTSFNHKKDQIRGMHYQLPPFEETKIVRCTMGAIFDVILDLRPESETYLQWHGEVLSSENRKTFYIPKGFAHGYMTLRDNTEIFYMMDSPYVKDAARELPYMDFNIKFEQGDCS